MFGGAFDFDQDLINISDSASFDSITSEITISAWIRRDADFDPSGSRIISKRTTSAGNDQWSLLGSQSLGDKIGMRITNGMCFGGNITINVWYHVVGTFNDTSNTCAMYINGVQNVTDNTRTETLSTNNQNVFIGHRENEGRWFYGLIDEIAIWNRTLSATEVAALYNYSKTKYYPVFQNKTGNDNTAYQWNVLGCDNAGQCAFAQNNFTFTVESDANPTVNLITPANDSTDTDGVITFNSNVTDDLEVANATLYTNMTGSWTSEETRWNGEINYNDSSLVLLMHFNNESFIGETSTHIYDWSRKGNNGTANGSTFNASGGKFGGAYQYDGLNEFIEIEDDTTLKPNTFTVSAWVNPTTNDTSSFCACGV